MVESRTALIEQLKVSLLSSSSPLVGRVAKSDLNSTEAY